MAGNYLRADDFFKNSRRTAIAEDVRRQIIEERRQSIIDVDLLRRLEDYSFLADKVFGAEDGYCW
jgi:hypothetical protein